MAIILEEMPKLPKIKRHGAPAHEDFRHRGVDYRRSKSFPLVKIFPSQPRAAALHEVLSACKDSSVAARPALDYRRSKSLPLAKILPSQPRAAALHVLLSCYGSHGHRVPLRDVCRHLDDCIQGLAQGYLRALRC